MQHGDKGYLLLGWVTFPVLNPADIALVQAHDSCQLFLGEPEVLSNLSKVFPCHFTLPVALRFLILLAISARLSITSRKLSVVGSGSGSGAGCLS